MTQTFYDKAHDQDDRIQCQEPILANIRKGILSDYTRVIIRTIPDHEEYSGPIGHEVRSACDSCMA